MCAKLKNREGKRIPEYDAAILSSSVTLQQIVEARYNLPKHSSVYEENSYEELLWLAYQHAHGKIQEYYFGMEGRDAVVLIKPHGHRKPMDLDLFYPLDQLSHLTPDFESTLWTCISQFQTIAELDIKFKSQNAVFLDLYLIVIYIFVVVEAQQANLQNQQADLQNRHHNALRRAKRITTTEDTTNKRIKQALDYANVRVGRLADNVEKFSTIKAQVVYIRGMLIGLFSVLVPVGAYAYLIFHISATHRWTSKTELFWHLITIAVTSGALGAVVSVILRISNRPLSVAYTAGRTLIWLAGFSRPIVGAIFGLVFYVLINAGLLQVLGSPPTIEKLAYFVAAICFAAGFSERRAQDFIVRVLPTQEGTESDADESPARRPEESRIADNTSAVQPLGFKPGSIQSRSTKPDTPGSTTV